MKVYQTVHPNDIGWIRLWNPATHFALGVHIIAPRFWHPDQNKLITENLPKWRQWMEELPKSKDKKVRDAANEILNNFGFYDLRYQLYGVNESKLPASYRNTGGWGSQGHDPISLFLMIHFNYHGNIFAQPCLSDLLFGKIVRYIKEYVSPYSYYYGPLAMGNETEIQKYVALTKNEIDLSKKVDPSTVHPGIGTAGGYTIPLVNIGMLVAIAGITAYFATRRG